MNMSTWRRVVDSNQCSRSQESVASAVHPLSWSGSRARHYMLGESWSYLTHLSTCDELVRRDDAIVVSIKLTSSTEAVINFRASRPTQTLTMEKSPLRNMDILPPCVPSLRSMGRALFEVISMDYDWGSTVWHTLRTSLDSDPKFFQYLRAIIYSTPHWRNLPQVWHDAIWPCPIPH